MKPEIKKEWVRRLRSGEIEQGTGALRRDEARCCLGVLSDMAVEEGVIPEPHQGEWGDWIYGERDKSFPPAVVLNWAGLTDRDPVVRLVENEDGEQFEYTVSELNDGGATFEEIANLIEAKL